MSFQNIFMAGLLGAIYTGSAEQHAWVPRSVLAPVGTAARFNCAAMNDEPVYWITMPYGSPETHDIYIGETFLLNGYGASERFSVEVDSTLRRYDLLIDKVKKSDAGIYICIDQRGIGNRSYAELVVWDKLSCKENQPHDSYMGENVFGLDQDALSFKCRMSYSGNIHPQFKWSVGGRQLTGTHGTDSGTTFSSLILAATRGLDGANVTCEAVIRTRSFEHTHTGVLWTSDTIHVKYAVLRKEIVEECPGVENTLRCNPSCSYKLEVIDGTKRCAVIYATGADVKWVFFYQSSQRSSENDECHSFGITLLISLCCLLFIALVLTLWFLTANKTYG